MKTTLFIFGLLLLGCDRASQARPSAAALPATLPGNGIVRGYVRFIGTAPVMSPIASTEKCCQGEPALTEQTVIVNPDQTLQNVFVYLEGAPATDGAVQPPATLDQVRCTYAPHVLGVQAGQSLLVRSSDPTMHNVHIQPQLNTAKNLSMTVPGQAQSISFEYAEFVRFKCDVHPWMTAWVGVFENPFFAVTRERGQFEINHIPPGTYKLVAWHELYGRQQQTITITDDKAAQTDFVFGRG